MGGTTQSGSWPCRADATAAFTKRSGINIKSLWNCHKAGNRTERPAWGLYSPTCHAPTKSKKKKRQNRLFSWPCQLAKTHL